MNQKTAVVTGGSRGIGHAIALQLAQEGYKLAIMDINYKEKVRDNLEQIRSVNGNLFISMGTSAPLRIGKSLHGKFGKNMAGWMSW